MLPEPVREVAKKMSQFYLRKYKGSYEKARTALLDLHITKVELTGDNTVSITVGRPGLFIGKRGTNVTELSEFLQMQIRIIEDMDCLYDYLIPRKEEEWDEY